MLPGGLCLNDDLRISSWVWRGVGLIVATATAIPRYLPRLIILAYHPRIVTRQDSPLSTLLSVETR